MITSEAYGIKKETSIKTHNIKAGITKFCNTNSDFLLIKIL
jgi:hypothetical protein